MKSLAFTPNNEYWSWFKTIKEKIQKAQIKAALSVNKELLSLYWSLGKEIVEKQNASKWGDGVIKQLSFDLKREMPNHKGFSRTNLFYIRQWYLFYKDSELVQQLVGLIPWGHNVTILENTKDIKEAEFYIKKTLENQWSRAVLVHFMEAKLYHNTSNALTNFKEKLPKPQSDLAQQMLKSSYMLDFLDAKEKIKERELEKQIINNITQFLLELGRGFAYMGKQYRLEIAGDEFFIDLLFYNTILKCYLVIEIKTGKFKPEYAGQLNFYITAINKQIKLNDDNPTLGLLLCKSGNKTVIEYALSYIDNPMGVAEYKLTKELPNKYKKIIPSQRELESITSKNYDEQKNNN